MKQILIPDDIIEQLKVFSEEKDVGMLAICFNGGTVILFSDKELGPNRAAVLAANMLLSGVVDNIWVEANDEAVKQEERDKKRRRTH